MKKIYISFAAAMLAAQASAVQPTAYPNFQITGISPDGHYAASSLYGTMRVIDLITGDVISFEEGDMGATYYEQGAGNYVSNTGIVLGSMFNTLNAAYIKDGEWFELNVPNPEFSNMANGITPDGLRICGSVGLSEFSTESTTSMLVPAVWNLQENGEYSDAVLLPHPELDFSGRVPQYITAISISDDGRTVAGQIRDYSGMCCEPIIYTLDDENNWSYSLPAHDLINPDHLVLPEDPGDGPVGPDMEDYMTEEEREAYEAAVMEWYMTFEGDYPDMLDYMSPEELDAYNEAYEAYQVVYAEWYERFTAFNDVLNEIFESSPEYEFNSVILSPDGKRLVTSQQFVDSDPLSWSRDVEFTSAIFNLENGEVTVLDKAYNMKPISITSAYTILGYTQESDPVNFVAKVWTEGAEQPMTLYSYMQMANANTAAWIEENMVHDIQMYDWESGEFVTYENVMITGVPLASADMSLVVTHVENYFDYETEAATYSYILPASAEVGIKAVESTQLALSTLPGAVLIVNGKASSLQVFDLNGRNVFEASDATGALSTGLGAGIYVVKATDASGDSIVRKVRF